MNSTRPCEFPDPSCIHSLLKRYVRVPIEADKTHLTAGDREALSKLVGAVRHIDTIYWRQRSEIGLELRRKARTSPGRIGDELDRLLSLNFGPWDNLDGDHPFWGGIPLPLAATSIPPTSIAKS